MKFYLERAKLNGFRTIKDLDLTFNKELNIIIGKNAVGKTNFLTFLYNVLIIEYKNLNDFQSEIHLNGDDQYILNSESSIDIEALKKNNSKIFTNYVNYISHKGEYIHFNGSNLSNLKATISERNLNFTTVFLKHGLPDNYTLVRNSFNFKIKKEEGLPFEILDAINAIGEQGLIFSREILFDLLLTIVNDSNYDKYNENDVKSLINSVFKRQIDKLTPLLCKYSPIKDLRLNHNFSTLANEDTISVNGLYLEFYVDDQWINFQSLSDGTKRVFMIISELSVCRFNDYKSYIYLIEEPELGIHPHQFSDLLDFIDEQSKFAQIIMTTHSPQSLNIIDEDSLTKIILAKNVKSKTVLRHFDDKEIEKAKEYLKEEYLSDYWLYSDLEN